MKILNKFHHTDDLVDYLNHPDYDPFDVSRALEALAHETATITIGNGKIVISPEQRVHSPIAMVA